MINLTKKTRNDNAIKKLINKDILAIEADLEIQNSFNDKILNFLKYFSKNITVPADLKQSNYIFENINNITKNLKKSNYNISSLEKLLRRLNSLTANLILIDDKFFESVDNYNSTYEKFYENIEQNNMEIQEFIATIPDFKDEIEADEIITNNFVEETVSKPVVSENKNKITENTLLISESEKKVILPYTLEQLNAILKEEPSKYQSIQDVIEKKYTIPLSYYKNSAISRFRESFKLIKHKEHGSLKDALDLAFETFTNYNLHPAIITACKTLNELDIYLACLEYNELEDFHYFDIRFNVSPTLATRKSVTS